MEINWIAILLAAFSSLIIGFIWYHPKVFGNAWMKEIGFTNEDTKDFSIIKTLGVSFIYAVFISITLQFLVIHQWGVFSSQAAIKEVDPSIYQNFMDVFGHTYRTFKHGALHGFLTGLFFAIPLVGTSALYEKRSFKYVLISGGYWLACFIVMGGIICMME